MKLRSDRGIIFGGHLIVDTASLAHLVLPAASGPARIFQRDGRVFEGTRLNTLLITSWWLQIRTDYQEKGGDKDAGEA